MKKTMIKKGKKAILEGANLIKRGEVVVFPTETVYGLGANAFDETAVKKIFLVKGRPQDNPLIVHVERKEQIYDLAKEVNEYAKIIMDKFMPGPITIILKKNPIISDVVTAGLDSVGIRMPKHTVARKFIKECALPIAAPSANISTHISPTTSKDVFEDLNGKVDLIIEGGRCNVGIESTIVDLTKEIPVILRPGGITQRMLTKALGCCQLFSGEVKVALAPGMKYKHYAPNCEMIVAHKEKIISAYNDALKEGKNPIIICEDNVSKDLQKVKFINLGKGANNIMKNIFSAMHEAQKISDYIICQHFGTRGARLSVMNRVVKAAGGNVL